jgi:yecA family protein
VIDTIVDHYNQISMWLAEDRFSYTPIFMRRQDGETSDRANGFYGATRLGLGHWRPLFETFEDSAPLMAILVHCADPDGESIYGEAMKNFPQRELKEGWRVIREAVHVVLDQCVPLRAANEQAAARSA